MRVTVLASLVLLAACSTATPPPAPPPGDDLRVPPVPPSALAASHPEGSAPEPLPRHPAGELAVDEGGPMPALGGACGDARSCGKSGKLAVARMSYHGGRPPPATPCKLAATADPQRSAGNAPMACVEGGKVYVANVCIFCRITSEQRLVGAIDDMTPTQLAEAQKLAALPAEPLLATADAWSRAIAAAAPPRR